MSRFERFTLGAFLGLALVLACAPSAQAEWPLGYDAATFDVTPEGRKLLTAVADDGSVFVAGVYTGTAKIAGDVLPPAVDANERTIFLAKIDSSGVPEWGRRIVGTAINPSSSGSAQVLGLNPTGLAVDSEGDVVIVGRHRQTVTIEGTTFDAGFFNPDGWIAKYRSNGAFAWAREETEDSLGGIGIAAQSFAPEYVAIDEADNVVVGLRSFGDIVHLNVVRFRDPDGNIISKTNAPNPEFAYLRGETGVSQMNIHGLVVRGDVSTDMFEIYAALQMKAFPSDVNVINIDRPDTCGELSSTRSIGPAVNGNVIVVVRMDSRPDDFGCIRWARSFDSDVNDQDSGFYEEVAGLGLTELGEVFVGGMKRPGFDLTTTEYVPSAGPVPSRSVVPGHAASSAFVALLGSDAGTLLKVESFAANYSLMTFAQNGTNGFEIAVLGGWNDQTQEIQGLRTTNIFDDPFESLWTNEIVGAPTTATTDIFQIHDGRIATRPGGGYVVVGLAGSGQDTVLRELFTPPDPARNADLTLPTAGGARNLFVARVTGSGAFVRPGDWLVGEPIEPPAGAVLTQLAQPEYVPSDASSKFAIAGEPGSETLIPLAPIDSVMINWRTSENLTDPARIDVLGAVQWPADLQLHVLGAPVDLRDAETGGLSVSPGASRLSVPAGVSISNNVELISVPGAAQGGCSGTRDEGDTCLYSVLAYNDALTGRLADVEVVRHVEALSVATDDASCTIGSPIDPVPSHVDPRGLGRGGYVLRPGAVYAPDRYDPASRLGDIVAVNRERVDIVTDGKLADDALLVAWYTENSTSGVAWPDTVVDYDCGWTATDFGGTSVRAAIENGLGSEWTGFVLDDTVYLGPQIYNQPDSSQPGFNPNDEHALLLPSNAGSGFPAVYPLRNQGVGNADSDPFVLVSYTTATGDSDFVVIEVTTTESAQSEIRFGAEVGLRVVPPFPLDQLPGCVDPSAIPDPDVERGTRGGILSDPLDPESDLLVDRPPFYVDRVGDVWPISAGEMVVEYFYPLQPEFYRLEPNDVQTPPGTCIAFLDDLTPTPDTPARVFYDTVWPDPLDPRVGFVTVGQTMVEAAQGVPNIAAQQSIEIVFDELYDASSATPAERPSLVQLIEPLAPVTVPMPAADLNAMIDFGELPADLVDRLFYDGQTEELGFRGVQQDSIFGPPLVLLNVMSVMDYERIAALDNVDTNFTDKLTELFHKTRNPGELDVEAPPGPDQLGDPTDRDATDADGTLIGLRDVSGGVGPDVAGRQRLIGGGGALTAGAAAGTGWATILVNNDPDTSTSPVEAYVIRVDCGPDGGPFPGRLEIFSPDNVFDERLTLVHSNDFGGLPERFTFEWERRPDDTGRSPAPPTALDRSGWIQEVSALSSANPGATQYTLEGSGSRTLADNWIYARFEGYPVCNNSDPNFSAWGGAPSGTATQPIAQLAPGWIKRVIAAINPFDARVQDFRQTPTQTQENILIQAGTRYAGDIALSDDPDNLNSIGLIETYTTLLERGVRLSIGANTPIDFGPANNSLLFAASRVSDLYMLLANEAYADASDPTIALGTSSVEFGSRASSIFAFQNQVPSLLEEELALLRGVDEGDDIGNLGSPVYNRLPWNFTGGDGEVAYQNAYRVTDITFSGGVDVDDAAIKFPQGHGDAWGHALTALTTYYRLLKDPNFTWEPRTESVILGNQPIHVDFLDERNFAQAALLKAKVGAEIVDLTYRSEYTQDPNGQWQGYKDTEAARAWGVDGWSRRAGQGAYFDWLTGNAILPAFDPEGADDGIEKIDRTTVVELGQIVDAFAKIETEVAEADRGLNPLGLARGVVPFDINAVAVDLDSGFAGQTHFNQISERALGALDNAVRIFDFANETSQALRLNQDSTDELASVAQDVEIDFENRLVELFGTPYPEDIGGGKLYPTGYDGPDLVHYNIVDSEEFTGNLEPETAPTTTYYSIPEGLEDFFNDNGQDDPSTPETTEVVVETALPSGTEILEGRGSREGTRRAPGEIQFRIQDVLRARTDLEAALLDHSNLVAEIEDRVDLLEALIDVSTERIAILDRQGDRTEELNAAIISAKAIQLTANRASELIDGSFDAVIQGLPKLIGFSNDPSFSVRAAVEASRTGLKATLAVGADIAEGTTFALETNKDLISLNSAIETAVQDATFEVTEAARELDRLGRELPGLELAIENQAEALDQAYGMYLATLEQGVRAIDDLVTFRRTLAGTVADFRYQDVAFRFIRNDALQKYRASFDLAARYAYLAASAYDYETNLLGTDAGSGARFLNDIVKERSLGHLIDGSPVAGTPGLADALARMDLTYGILAPQFGFNNPQTETNRFSLRRELFRICSQSDSGCDADDPNQVWRDTLARHRVANLFDLPEFRRFARPFAPEFLGAQPAIVIPFGTTVTAGLNFFGNELAPGDSSYDATQFSTKVRAVGTWFTGYDTSGLSNTPRVYLIPTGLDVLRSPDAFNFTTREWRVQDQKIPVPFPIGSADLNDASWIPQNDSLLEDLFGVRRFSRYRAYHVAEGDLDPASQNEVASDSRLVGRSVWNTEWTLIIPGQTLLFDADDGLDTFIHGQCVAPAPPGQDCVRDGNGIADIQMFFQTYSFSGN